MATLSAKFLAKFDPKNSKHVLWFKRMCEVGDQMTNPKTQVMLVGEINMNPMNVEIDHREALQWVEVHFCLAMKYSKAVVNNEAWIPPAPENYKVTGV
jgi:hypothetical protein